MNQLEAKAVPQAALSPPDLCSLLPGPGEPLHEVGDLHLGHLEQEFYYEGDKEYEQHLSVMPLVSKIGQQKYWYVSWHLLSLFPDVIHRPGFCDVHDHDHPVGALVDVEKLCIKPWSEILTGL